MTFKNGHDVPQLDQGVRQSDDIVVDRGGVDAVDDADRWRDDIPMHCKDFLQAFAQQRRPALVGLGHERFQRQLLVWCDANTGRSGGAVAALSADDTC